MKMKLIAVITVFVLSSLGQALVLTAAAQVPQVVQLPPLPPVTPTKVVQTLGHPINVAPDAQGFNGHWYKVVYEKATWHDARAKCEQLGGHLAIVQDAATWTYIKSIAGVASLWLGATDEAQEGRWLWVNGSPMEFKAWGKGQPDNKNGNENYLMISKGVMNDIQQSGVYSLKKDHVAGYICEW